jgi:hypothetical protein
VASYAFTTIWRLDAPVTEVFGLIDRIEAWPAWWPSVLRVVRLQAGGEDGVGARYRLTFRGRLPYELHFTSRVTRREAPQVIRGAATGELEGNGTWHLREDEGWTTVRYDWHIRTTRRWMNALAVLPFVREIFALNHHAVMRRGLAGICRELGVRGTYERVD